MTAQPFRWIEKTIVFFALSCSAATLSGEIVRYEITAREPFADGKVFGEVGEYEVISGRVHYRIDPGNAANKAIRDLQLAPRNDDGLVEFQSDLFVLAPRDLNRGNGTVLYDVNNRGNKLALRFFNDSRGGNDAADPGHGFLMREGFTVVWSGWDGELLDGGGRMRLFSPVARRANGDSIKGPVRFEIAPSQDDATRLPLSRGGHGAYPPTKQGRASATLTWRLRVDDPRAPIPRDQFKLHVTESSASPQGQLPKVELEIPAGFRKGYLYELVYEARDPLVHGVTFASVRDLMTSLKHGGGEQHPLLVEGKPVIERAIGFGVSQSGRYLREFVYWGFNLDEQKRLAFDGVIPHVAGGGLGSFNHRFAQPTAFATQRELRDWNTDRFPFSYEQQTNPHTGASDGILGRSVSANSAPLVFHTQSSAEYWTRSGSLPHTDPLGNRDAELPANVRVYAFGGTQHGPSGYPPSRSNAQNAGNPGDYKPFLRALLIALDNWAKSDDPPPPSVYPKIADKTLVKFDRASTGFPHIPGVRYPEVINQPWLLDFGKSLDSTGVITRQPPLKVKPYGVRVAKCDADGNPLGCLNPPEVRVPLATFTGWNLQNREAGAESELVGLRGSYIPFALTRGDRIEVGDPRPAIGERYASIDAYLQKLEKQCRQFVAQGYLLEEDVERIVNRQRERAAPLFEKISADDQ
ncbi:MAG: alpha/beta hydrolase domain-containing protein [Pirellulaceae bacterium]|jgi:hypothetical protein|nr:alpha/beta hydrolase domain-containing protein [Pirellulaceae bacterium]MDP7014564.1 alpha/beta hydrolase domain-containing protein [Pirellulaceae bacterium]